MAESRGRNMRPTAPSDDIMNSRNPNIIPSVAVDAYWKQHYGEDCPYRQKQPLARNDSKNRAYYNSNKVKSTQFEEESYQRLLVKSRNMTSLRNNAKETAYNIQLQLKGNSSPRAGSGHTPLRWPEDIQSGPHHVTRQKFSEPKGRELLARPPSSGRRSACTFSRPKDPRARGNFNASHQQNLANRPYAEVQQFNQSGNGSNASSMADMQQRIYHLYGIPTFNSPAQLQAMHQTQDNVRNDHYQQQQQQYSTPSHGAEGGYLPMGATPPHAEQPLDSAPKPSTIQQTRSGETSATGAGGTAAQINRTNSQPDSVPASKSKTSPKSSSLFGSMMSNMNQWVNDNIKGLKGMKRPKIQPMMEELAGSPTPAPAPLLGVPDFAELAAQDAAAAAASRREEEEANNQAALRTMSQYQATSLATDTQSNVGMSSTGAAAIEVDPQLTTAIVATGNDYITNHGQVNPSAVYSKFAALSAASPLQTGTYDQNIIYQESQYPYHSATTGNTGSPGMEIGDVARNTFADDVENDEMGGDSDQLHSPSIGADGKDAERWRDAKQKELDRMMRQYKTATRNSGRSGEENNRSSVDGGSPGVVCSKTEMNYHNEHNHVLSNRGKNSSHQHLEIPLSLQGESPRETVEQQQYATVASASSGASANTPNSLPARPKTSSGQSSKLHQQQQAKAPPSGGMQLRRPNSASASVQQGRKKESGTKENASQRAANSSAVSPAGKAGAAPTVSFESPVQGAQVPRAATTGRPVTAEQRKKDNAAKPVTSADRPSTAPAAGKTPTKSAKNETPTSSEKDVVVNSEAEVVEKESKSNGDAEVGAAASANSQSIQPEATKPECVVSDAKTEESASQPVNEVVQKSEMSGEELKVAAKTEDASPSSPFAVEPKAKPAMKHPLFGGGGPGGLPKGGNFLASLQASKNSLKKVAKDPEPAAEELTEDAPLSEQQKNILNDRLQHYEKFLKVVDAHEIPKLTFKDNFQNQGRNALLGRGKFAAVFEANCKDPETNQTLSHRKNCTSHIYALKIAQYRLPSSAGAGSALPAAGVVGGPAPLRVHHHPKLKYLKEPPVAILQEYIREVEAMKQFNHRNILHLYGVLLPAPLNAESAGADLSGVDFSLSYNMGLVLECMTMGNLATLLDQEGWQADNGLKERISILQDVAAGLAYMHGLNYVHRDIKLHNIMLTKGSAGVIAKLSDFGTSVQLNKGETLDEPMGTMGYLAPEIFTGGYSHPIDVFAFAVVAWAVFSQNRVNPMADASAEGMLQKSKSSRVALLSEMGPDSDDDNADGRGKRKFDKSAYEKAEQAVRPKFGPEHPALLVEMIEGSWIYLPSLRPTMGAIDELLEMLSSSPQSLLLAYDRKYAHFLNLNKAAISKDHDPSHYSVPTTPHLAALYAQGIDAHHSPLSSAATSPKHMGTSRKFERELNVELDESKPTSNEVTDARSPGKIAATEFAAELEAEQNARGEANDDDSAADVQPRSVKSLMTNVGNQLVSSVLQLSPKNTQSSSGGGFSIPKLSLGGNSKIAPEAEAENSGSEKSENKQTGIIGFIKRTLTPRSARNNDSIAST